MPLILTVTGGDPAAAPAPLPLAEGRDIVIGRSPEADWTLPDASQQISSRHSVIRHQAGRYLIADTSTNGTIVNGATIRGPHALAAGDVIRIGDYDIAVREAGAGMATAAGGAQATLVRGLHLLLATRRRQLGELGATVPDALAANPLAIDDPKAAAAALAALAPAAADQAIVQAVQAIELHHAASLAAMQGGLRAAMARFEPAAIAAANPNAGRLPAGDARDAALWRAFAAACAAPAPGGFVEAFARDFRAAYEARARTC